MSGAETNRDQTKIRDQTNNLRPDHVLVLTTESFNIHWYQIHNYRLYQSMASLIHQAVVYVSISSIVTKLNAL